jgi:hypothetical protein
VALCLLFGSGCVAGLVVPPLLATAGGLVSTHARALSLAVMGLLSALVGNGMGPLAVGFLSDQMRPVFGAESLRYGLASMTALILWGVFHLYLASKHLRDDLE